MHVESSTWRINRLAAGVRKLSVAAHPHGQSVEGAAGAGARRTKFSPSTNQTQHSRDTRR